MEVSTQDNIILSNHALKATPLNTVLRLSVLNTVLRLSFHIRNSVD